MNQIIYQNRCRCNEEISLEKKRAAFNRISEGRSLKYPWKDPDHKEDLTEVDAFFQTFVIKYETTFSGIAKVLLQTLNDKYIYYAMDDILYGSPLTPKERENLLAILYSPIILLQNNYSINFLDIWIHSIYLEEVSETNRFLINESPTSKTSSYLTLQLQYKPKGTIKKQETLW